MAISLEGERAQTADDLLEALKGIGLEPRQVVPGRSIWGARTEGWRLELHQATPVALVVNVERLSWPNRIRRLMQLVSPHLHGGGDGRSLTLSNEGQEVVLFKAGRVIFRPEFDPPLNESYKFVEEI